MYGYIVPDKTTLSASDYVLYRAFYCGVCCQTGRLYGQLPRMTTNYDFAFLSALLFDYAQADIVIEEHTCVLNPVKKKATLMGSPLLERIAAVNIMLSYQKALDGIEDGDGVKYRVAKSALSRAHKKACAAYPDIRAEISRSYAELRKAEKAGVQSIDRAAEPFAALLSRLPELILGRPVGEPMKRLCYNIGKFVYLADALDDIDDDFKKKRYNPFLARYGDYADRRQFIAAHRDDLDFCFRAVCGRAEASLAELTFTQSYSLIRNIVIAGMKEKSKELLGSTRKLPNPKV